MHPVISQLPAPAPGQLESWLISAAVAGIVVLCFLGMAYSFWPDIVPWRMTIFQAAGSSP